MSLCFRNKAYDADARTDQFFNLPEVKRDIHADPKITWAACSDIVDDIMGHDVMKSVKKLIPDIIHRYPVLIYLGQFDAECGVAANDAWVHSLPWCVTVMPASCIICHATACSYVT